MSVAANQKRTFLRLLDALRPHWRRDRALPQRLAPLLANRHFGSRDRRLYRELTYTALRLLPWIEHAPDDLLVTRVATASADLPATRVFREAWADPASLHGLDPADLLPLWLRDECPRAFQPAPLATLLTRAPLWLRIQTEDTTDLLAEFQSLGWTPSPHPLLPSAWRLPPDLPVTTTEAHRLGLFEVQDLGSQLILAAHHLPPHARWLDACAGAGGKTLQLARLLGPTAQIDAHDIRPAALTELHSRAQRAHLADRIHLTPSPLGPYDAILVDAPCSGSGTWRRSPHLKWTTSPDDLAAAARTQLRLLLENARLLNPGGLLLYATCSLCHSENEAVATAFLAARPDFTPVPPALLFGFPPASPTGLAIHPEVHDTDAFYTAAFQLTR